jgi:aspartyl/asparaginyl beta-hydroxylase (cupin superfamily)
LGIHVPNPNEKCAIRVGNITKKWHRGQVLIFDDFITHEAWNFSDQIRINLLLDIKYTEKSYMIRNNDIDCHTADFSGGLRNMLSKIDKNK